MAVEWTVEHSRSSEYLFLPEDITIKPELNGRHELPNIDWLVKDILAQGQLQPVLIRNDGGKPVLCVGHSRWRAVLKINKDKLAPVALKLRCVYFKGNEQAGFRASISENRIRNSTTALDEAYCISKLHMWGYANDAIAAIYFPDVNPLDTEAMKPCIRWVKARAKLVSLDPAVQAKVSSGQMKPTAAAHLAKLTAEQQREAVTDGAEKVKKTKSLRPSSKEVVLLIEQWQDDTTAPKTVRRFCTQLLAYIRGEGKKDFEIEEEA
jgi:hypothetical protein